MMRINYMPAIRGSIISRATATVSSQPPRRQLAENARLNETKPTDRYQKLMAMHECHTRTPAPTILLGIGVLALLATASAGVDKIGGAVITHPLAHFLWRITDKIFSVVRFV
jgi:hypothetical protein